MIPPFPAVRLPLARVDKESARLPRPPGGLGRADWVKGPSLSSGLRLKRLLQVAATRGSYL